MGKWRDPVLRQQYHVTLRKTSNKIKKRRRNWEPEVALLSPDFDLGGAEFSSAFSNCVGLTQLITMRKMKTELIQHATRQWRNIKHVLLDTIKKAHF